MKGKWTHGRLTQEAYLAACEDLFARVRGDSLEIEDAPIFSKDSRAIYDEVEKLAQKHSLDISDALQLLTLRSGTYSRLEGTARASLVTADRKLACAARAEGMRAWDCVHDPVLPTVQIRVNLTEFESGEDRRIRGAVGPLAR